jgi:hypothetical protein
VTGEAAALVEEEDREDTNSSRYLSSFKPCFPP